MPVIDHEVHEKVKINSSTFRYGCFNKRQYPNYLFREFVGNRIEVKYIEHRMSRECRYDKSLTDYACEGCEHRGTGEKYAEMVSKASQSS